MAFEKLGEALLELRTDDKGLKKDIREARRMSTELDSHFADTARHAEKMEVNIKRAAIAVTAVATAAVGMAVAFTRSVVGAARTAENLRLRLNALLGSVEEGSKAFDLMSQFAATVPFEFADIMNSATQLAGIVHGGAQEIAGLMPMIADLAAVSGLTIQQTTEQIVRSFSAGIGSADLFRERGITAMLGFQAGVSYTAEETRSRIVAAWEDAGSKFRGASEKMASTWDGLMSMLSDRWFQFRVVVADAGLFDFLKEQLQKILEFADKVMKRLIPIFKAGGEELRRLAEEIGLMVGASFALGFLAGIKLVHTGLRDLMTGLIPFFGDKIIRPIIQKFDLFATAFDALMGTLRDTVHGSLAEIDAIAADAAERLAARGRGGGPAPTGGGRGGAGGPVAFLGSARRYGERSGLIPPNLELATLNPEEKYQAREAARALERLASWTDRSTDAMQDLGKTVQVNLGSAIAGVVNGFRSLGDATVGLIQAFFNAAIAAGIERLLPFQSGGMVPALTPALLHPGEAVLNRRAVAAIGGAPAVDAINSGTGSVSVRLSFEGIKAPDPADYGIPATSPQMMAWLNALLKRAEALGLIDRYKR